jgi:DNA polymerase I-like protein with 3'-5' exonuclease and polymerase domains
VIINADAKALEWLGAVYLSGDTTGYSEIRAGIDQHQLNQEAFGLPTRLIAKTFVFRLIYGGGAYSYANDPDFMGVSTEEKFWQGIIDAFYKKYEGIHDWHQELMYEAMSTGQVRIPTGRTFPFKANEKGKWPRTQILNYPVQGFGADFMVLARVLLNSALLPLFSHGLRSISTVHDSIVWDCPSTQVDDTVNLIYKTWDTIPLEFEKRFGVPFDLPTKVEVSVGKNWKETK